MIGLLLPSKRLGGGRQGKRRVDDCLAILGHQPLGHRLQVARDCSLSVAVDLEAQGKHRIVLRPVLHAPVSGQLVVFTQLLHHQGFGERAAHGGFDQHRLLHLLLGREPDKVARLGPVLRVVPPVPQVAYRLESLGRARGCVQVVGNGVGTLSHRGPRGRHENPRLGGVEVVFLHLGPLDCVLEDFGNRPLAIGEGRRERLGLPRRVEPYCVDLDGRGR